MTKPTLIKRNGSWLVRYPLDNTNYDTRLTQQLVDRLNTPPPVPHHDVQYVSQFRG